MTEYWDLHTASNRIRTLVMLESVAALILLLFFSFPRLLSAWHNNMGIVDLTKRFSDQGIQAVAVMNSHFNRAIQWNRSAHQPYIGLARLYMRQGNPMAAADVLQEVLKLNRGHAIAQFELGNVYKTMGEYGKAIEQWTSIGASSPLVQLGDELMAEEKEEAAKRAYEAAIMVDPDNRFAHWGLARLYQERGVQDHAIQEFMEVIRIAPQLIWPYLEIGNIYRDGGDFEKALEWYERAKRVDPGNFAPYLGTARIYWDEKHDKDRAISELTRAIEVDPQVASLYIFLGNIHRDTQEYEEAKHWYERAAEIEPMDPLPYWALGFVFLKQGLHEQAVREFEKAAIRSPQDPEIHWWLAKAYSLQGDKTRALRELHEAISLGGEDVDKYKEEIRKLEMEQRD